MPLPEPVRLLHAEYAELATRSRSTLSVDQRLSLVYYQLDLLTPSALEIRGNTRPVAWTRGLHRLDAFVETEGRMPRENNRARIPAAEREVDRWVKRQRVARRAGALVTYQQRRLLCVAGFRWDPLEDAWNERCRAYGAFFRSYRRVPAARSPDLFESRLGRWADKQRWYYWHGRLPAHRIRALEQLPAWTWGSRGR